MKDEKAQPVEFRGTGFYVGLAAILLFAVVLLILAVQNTQDVTIDFLGWNFTVPLFAVAIGAALIAIIIDELVGLVWRRRRRSLLAERAELASLRAAKTSVESEVDLVPDPRIDTSLDREPDAVDPKPDTPT